jgi:hypothetical protein
MKTLAFISTGLIAVILGEINYAKQSKLKLDEELTEETVKQIELETLPSINLKKKKIGYYIDFIERPLFNHDRKPISIDIDLQTNTDIKEKVKAVIDKKVKINIKPFKHELIGVYGIKSHRTALFRNKTPKTLLVLKNKQEKKKDENYKEKKYEKFIRLKIGSIFDKWQVKAIHSNSVVIENQGQTETVGWSKYRPTPAKKYKRIKSAKLTFKERKRKAFNKNKRQRNKKNNPFLQAQKKKKNTRNKTSRPPSVVR